MADGKIKISELGQALQINDDAFIPFSQDNSGTPTTYGMLVTQLARKIAEGVTLTNLTTTSKNLVGAINELKLLSGTSAPTSQQGADGSLYVKYTEGTGGADDTVDALYVKIDGAWCEISTGGGGGTTDYEDLSNKPQVNSVELVGNKSLDDLGIMPASLSKTVSGSIAHITDGADNIPVKSLVSEIVATGGGGTPDAPIAINGFDSGIITRCGKNLLENRRTTTTLNGVTFTVNNDGSITLSGTASTNFQYNLNNSHLKSAKYTMSNGNTNLISGITLFAVTPSGNKDVNRTTGFVTFEDSVGLVALWITSGTNTNGVTIKPMIEQGETATDYESYNGNTYTFTFGQTVYGGHFDNKGNLVVTDYAVLIGDLTWTDQSIANHVFTAIITGKKNAISSGVPDNLSCEIYDTLGGDYVISGNNNNSIGSSIANSRIFVCDTRFNSASDFKTACASYKIRYKLATPTTLSITSQDIPTLLGENNIFSNCGDVEVTYYTDNADEIVEVAKATASIPLHNYSTDEQVVGTWIDGSTLYEKTFDLTLVSLTNATWTNNVLGTSSSNIKIRKFSGTFNISGGGYVNEPYADYIYYRSGDEYFTAVVNDAGNDLNLRPQIDGVTTTAGVCTIQYTKTST